MPKEKGDLAFSWQGHPGVPSEQHLPQQCSDKFQGQPPYLHETTDHATQAIIGSVEGDRGDGGTVCCNHVGTMAVVSNEPIACKSSVLNQPIDDGASGLQPSSITHSPTENDSFFGDWVTISQ